MSDPSPLRPNWFHILLTLADGPRHGYAIMREVTERTDGAVRLWPATLYSTIRRLEEEDLVEPVDVDEPPEDSDERRQYYDLTARGRKALAVEVRRLEGLVRLARDKGAVT